ncbi:MAG: glycosyltransferase [Chloroflexota bacterium]
MRILHLVHQYVPEHVGGVELYTQMMAHYQQQRGHETAVFTPTNYPITHQPTTVAVEDGTHVYRIPAGRRSRNRVFCDTFYQPHLHRALQATLAHERPDVVHIQHLMGLPFSLVKAITQAQIPFLITLHDYWYGCANAQLITNDTETLCAGPDAHYHNCGRCLLARAGQPHLYGLAPAVAPLMAARNRHLRHILPRAHAVVTLTQFVQQAYEKMGLPTANFVLSPLGIDVPQEKLAALRQQRPPRDPQQLHIGYVGSIAWQKGVHDLVTAVNQLPPTAYASPFMAASTPTLTTQPTFNAAPPIPASALRDALRVTPSGKRSLSSICLSCQHAGTKAHPPPFKRRLQPMCPSSPQISARCPKKFGTAWMAYFSRPEIRTPYATPSPAFSMNRNW